MEAIAQAGVLDTVALFTPRKGVVMIKTSEAFARHAPRRIRARLALAQHRKAVQAAAMAASRMAVVETQCIVVHNAVTGKAAMGPWMGSYGSSDDEQPSSLMYTDISGVVFGSLEGAAVVMMMETGSVSSTAQAIDMHNAQMLPPVCDMRREQSAKMDAMEFRRPRHEMNGRHPRGNYALRSQYGLKQPRQGY